MSAPTPENEQKLALIENEWKARLDALNALIDTLDSYVIPDSSINDRDSTIRYLLKQTKNFSGQVYRFFVKGTQPGNLIRNEENSDKLASPKVLVASIPTIILDQIATDIGIFWNAFQQRIVSALWEGHQRQPQMISQTLNLADHLAWLAKSHFPTVLNPKQRVTVLSLLEARAQVRLFPYAPVAVIGVPLTAIRYVNQVGDPQAGDHQAVKDFLGIPHEFAHYLYWYGRKTCPDKLLRESLNAKLAEMSIECDTNGQKKRVCYWLEEIFADVVGCLIAGPVVALSLQEMLAGGRIEDFYTDHGTHPIHSVRPFILTQALRHMGLCEIAEKLQDQWKKKLEVLRVEFSQLNEMDMSASTPLDWKFPIFDETELDQSNVDKWIDLATLDKVVIAIQCLITQDNTPLNSPWTKGVGNEPKMLYAEFNNFVRSKFFRDNDLLPLPAELEPPESQPCDTPDFATIITDILSKNAEQKLSDAAGGSNWKVLFNDAAKITESNNPLYDNPLPDNQIKVPATVWMEILTFGGWTTGIDRSPRFTGSIRV